MAEYMKATRVAAPRQAIKKRPQRAAYDEQSEEETSQAHERSPKRAKYGLKIYDGPIDIVFFAIVIVLLGYGIIMMFSASYVAGLNLDPPDGYRYVKTQGFAAVVGVILMIIISFWDYHVLMNSKIVIFGFAFTIALMLLCFAPEPLGHAEAGAHRWINIAGQSFQPSELMKAVLIVFVALLMCNNSDRLNEKRFYVPLTLLIGFVCALMVVQRHLSGTIIMGVIAMVVVFIGGMKMKTILKMLAILAVGGSAVLVIYASTRETGLSYIFDRFSGMGQASEGEITAESWQTAQSLIAIGSGGWFGLGFGESRQKYAWLPESQNDFIFPIIVEELGYLGGIVVVILFALFIYRGFYIAKKARDKFGMLIVAGMTFQIGFQALLNIGVACNAFPNTGISLPFFSYGGTALLLQLAEMGIILAVSRQCEI